LHRFFGKLVPVAIRGLKKATDRGLALAVFDHIGLKAAVDNFPGDG
jgi:hypothetical protein